MNPDEKAQLRVREPSGHGDDHSTRFRDLRLAAKVGVVAALALYLGAIIMLTLTIGLGRV